MTMEELKIRQLSNQSLLRSAPKLTVIRQLCGFQAQFLPNALHAMQLRCIDYTPETAAAGLVKNWTIRGTVHIFAESDLPLFLHCANGTRYHNNTWHGYSFWNQRDQWALTPERQAFLSDIILDAVQNGPKTRDALKDICQAHGMTAAEKASMFDSWGGGIRELCERGFLNYTVQEKKAFCLAPPFVPIPEEEANLEIARRYFSNYGPATVHDAMYYFHTTAAQVRTWLSKLPVKTTECDGKTYYFIDNGNSYKEEIPACIFLAGFDPLMLGYEKKESIYLPQAYLRGIFNLAGIVMPAILLHGEVIGKWQKKKKKLTLTYFRPLSADDIHHIWSAAEKQWQDIQIIETTE